MASTKKAPHPIWVFYSQAIKANFCPDCGTILDFPSDLSKPIVCDVCNFSCRIEDLDTRDIITEQLSPAEALKRSQAKRSKKDDEEEHFKGAIVDEECEKCGNKQAFYKTMQTRSADEGQTVFYQCTKCRFAWSTNT